MKPYIHAKNSVNKYGGKIEDYLPIHDFMDSSKAHFPDVRHRAIFHSSFGIFITEKVFGTYITNSDGKIIQVRDVAEDHVMEDLGTIPTVADYLNHLPVQKWMGGPSKKKTEISYDELDEEEQEEEEEIQEEKIAKSKKKNGQSIEDLKKKIKDLQKELDEERNKVPFIPGIPSVPSVPWDPFPQPRDHRPWKYPGAGDPPFDPYKPTIID